MPQFADKQSLVDFMKDDDQNDEDVLFDAQRATTQNDINNELSNSINANNDLAASFAA